ncbi:MAG TPA: hypothetical protein VK053_01600 [Jiangellaceae bacterium]|nr:hypothetical protein [Jiangellaceae bacterium]
MPRKVAPCGTLTAYNRHKRRGEDACEPCLEAKRQDKAERVAAQRAEAAGRAAEARAGMTPEGDRLELLREQRDILRAHSKEAPPQSVASISKQLVAVLAEIAELEAAEKSAGGSVSGGAQEGGGGIDDIARRRAEREARRRAAAQG